MTKKNTWEIIDLVLAHSNRVLLIGRPATGKTWAANKSGLRKDQSVYNITLTPEMSSAELRGHYVPAGDKFVWQDGVAIKAWREGARLVMNEIDQASGDVWTLLHAILDDMEIAGITLPTGEAVRPARGFNAIATMNGSTEDLPIAIKDRFPIIIEISDAPEPAYAKLPSDIRSSARNSMRETDNNRRISIRCWAEFAKLRQKIDPDTAAQACFGSRAAEVMNAIQIENSRKTK